MKAITSNKKIKASVVTIIVCAALALCAVFSFGFKSRSAAEAQALSDQDGIRFVQVAAGEDFAIGLTYDGRLFGWSLTGNTTSRDTSDSNTTLGKYYTDIPTEIPVTFRVGPGSNNTAWSSGGYHTATDKSVDNTPLKITQIAATRYTAAFITNNGYIYTWGRDLGQYKDIGGNAYSNTDFGYGNDDNYHFLLLRPANGGSNADEVWYKPYIIEYDYFMIGRRNNPALSNLTSGLHNASIAGGEYNYNFVYSKSNTWYSYVWGSSMYAVSHRAYSDADTYYDLLSDSAETNFKVAEDFVNYRMVYETDYTTTAISSVTAVAGGYTVGMNASAIGSGISNSTSLTLRGKNFITSQNVNLVGEAVDNVQSATITRTVATNGQTPAEGNTDATSVIRYQQSGTTYNVAGAIIGAYKSEPNASNGILGSADPSYGTDLYYARQAVESGNNITYTVANPTGDNTGIYSAKRLSGADAAQLSGVNYSTIKLNAVSLGNDIGYGIDGDNKLYAWGDNSEGQLANDPDSFAFKSNPYPILSDKTIVSVAAGKQITTRDESDPKSYKAFNSTSTLTAVSGDATQLAFNDKVKNNAAYISGAIDDDGVLYVWSDLDYAPTPIYFGGSSSNTYNGFVAVYSGYGRNLFAVTKLGKLVRISRGNTDSDYTQKIYDDFADSTGKVDNWKLNGAGVNTIKFEVSKTELAGDPTPDLGSYTIYVDNGVSGKETAKLNEGNGLLGDFGSLVTTDNIGDAYRIIDDAHKPASYLNAVAYVGSGTAPTSTASLNPTFTFTPKGGTAKAMTPLQQKYMFDCEVVYDENGAGIKITPQQSSKQGTVTVKFYVARYDAKVNFKVSGSTVTDNALYYDYADCTFTFEVDNTPAYMHFNQLSSGGLGENPIQGNSNIPLLDPNNTYNKSYSVAVQNVSAGVSPLASFLTANDTAKAAALENAITALMKRADAGFPDSDKIAKGNLEYYLSRAVANWAYGDTYQYLLADRDADRLMIQNCDPIGYAGPNSGSVINGSVQNDGASRIRIRFTADVVAELVTAGVLSSGTTLESLFSVDALKSFATDFNNTYGYYNFSYTTDQSTGDLTSVEFSYDVVMFTAENSTGVLNYGADGASSADVTSYVTTVVSEGVQNNAYASVPVNYTEYIRYNSDYVTQITGLAQDDSVNYHETEVVAVFAQGSLRLRTESKGSDSEPKYNLTDHTGSGTPSGIAAYGDADSGLNEVYINDNNATGVKRVGSTWKVKLSDYVDMPGSYISFSYKGSRGDSLTEFGSEFPDPLDNTKNKVSLSRSEITISPTTADDILLTVTIQRFYGMLDGTFTNGNECITIHFVFSNIRPVNLQTNTISTDRPISDTTTIDFWGQTPTAYNAGSPLTNLTRANYGDATVKITELRSSDTSVLSVAREGLLFTITPKESGTAQVQFVATVYGESVPISLTFNVAGITTVKDGDSEYTVSLSGKQQYVYISKLKTALTNSIASLGEAASSGINVDNYSLLYSDIKDGVPAAVYFKKWDNGNESDLDAGEVYPPFIKSVSFQDYAEDGSRDGSAYIRLEFNDENEDMDSLSDKYRMHVRFVDKTRGYASYDEASNVLDTAFIVESTKKVAKENGVMLTINVDVDSPRSESEANGEWYVIAYSKTNFEIMIPLSYLMKKADPNVASEDYAIFLVSAPDGTTSYFNYDKTSEGDYVKITPYYNTDGVVTVDVSAQKTKGTASNQVISFGISVTGISTTLTKSEYSTIWIVAFFSSLGLLLIIFLIRMIVYWRRRAKQRALIKRNQELIKMRDRMHNRAAAASREQVVRTKLKMEDPKYAKMFSEIKKGKTAQVDSTGVMVGGVDFDAGDKKAKKKKSSKKSMAELKAELAAKKAAFAQAQNVDMPYTAQPVDPFAGAPQGDMGYGAPDQNYGSPADAFNASDLDGNSIIFDAQDMDNGAQG